MILGFGRERQPIDERYRRHEVREGERLDERTVLDTPPGASAQLLLDLIGTEEAMAPGSLTHASHHEPSVITMYVAIAAPDFVMPMMSNRVAPAGTVASDTK